MRNYKTINKQGGWTFWGLAFTLSVLGFFSYIGMQLVPLHMNNNNIVNAMTQSVDDQDLRRITRGEIVKKINRQLYLDESHRGLDLKKTLKVSRSRSQFIVEMIYDREIPIFLDHFVVVKFRPRLECTLEGQCKKTKGPLNPDDKKK